MEIFGSRYDWLNIFLLCISIFWVFLGGRDWGEMGMTTIGSSRSHTQQKEVYLIGYFFWVSGTRHLFHDYIITSRVSDAVEVIESVRYVCVCVCVCVRVCVCLSVCNSAVSWLNGLTYGHEFWYGDTPS